MLIKFAWLGVCFAGLGLFVRSDFAKSLHIASFDLFVGFSLICIVIGYIIMNKAERIGDERYFIGAGG